MQIVLIIAGVFIVSALTLALIAKLFSNTPVEGRTILAAAAVMLLMLAPMSFLPMLGWFIGLVINMLILRVLLECSMMDALMAIILWGGSIVIVLYFADQMSLINILGQF